MQTGWFLEEIDLRMSNLWQVLKLEKKLTFGAQEDR